MSTLVDTDVDTESGAKPRRPDRAVYVPRALRAHDPAHNTAHDIAPDTAHDIASDIAHDIAHDPTDDARPPESKKTNTSARCPKSPGPRERSAPGTPKRSADRHFCNVYTPPHLRPQPRDDRPVPSVPNSDSAISFSDNSRNGADESFYIGNYFANGQLGFYAPSLFEFGSDREGGRRADASREQTMARPDARSDAVDDMTSTSIIGEYAYDKGEDAEADELKRASREINRSSKRIIKQSFDSDVLVISDPVEEAPARRSSGDADAERPEASPKQKLEAKTSLKREENDWDAVFDDSGECLDPSLLEELAGSVGRVHVTRPRASYAQYQTRGQALAGTPDAFAHVLEVYDFPSEFDTNDLLALFSDYKDTGFEIKWVDDTHALIVFSSANVAAEVLSAPRALARCRPLHAATLESRNKAKKCAEFLQPYRQRPETCTALARRLVSGALGVRLSTARQERAEERRLITRAREKKRQAALHKEAAWDGSLANTTPANTSLANTSLDA